MENTNCKNTLELFRCLSKIDDIDRCLLFCMPAIDTLKSRLRDQSLNVDDVYALYNAAAYLAFYKAIISDELCGFDSFKAGQITLNTSLQKKRELALESLRFAVVAAKPYLKTGTVFKSVGGGL